MSDAPPSRYKVVEKGGRLVVIDGNSAQPTAGAMGRQVAPADRQSRKGMRPIYRLVTGVASLTAASGRDESGRLYVSVVDAETQDARSVPLDEGAIWRAGLSTLGFLVATAAIIYALGFLMAPILIAIVIFGFVRFGVDRNGNALYPEEDGVDGEPAIIPSIYRSWLRWVAGERATRRAFGDVPSAEEE